MNGFVRSCIFIAAGGIGLIVSTATLAQECLLDNRATLDGIAMSADKFFERPVGSIAISENCGKDNYCKRYFDITPCQTVRYATDPSDAERPVAISVNSVQPCPNDVNPLALFGPTCRRSSFLAASMTLTVDKSANRALSLDVVRNDGEWSAPSRSERRINPKKYVQPFTKTLSQAGLTNFIALSSQEPDPGLTAFEDGLTPFWHSFWNSGGDIRATWNDRSFFGSTETIGCCSVKAFLLKFTESAPPKPSTKPLLFSGKTRAFTQLVVRTMAPDTDEDYSRTRTIQLLH